MNKYNPRSLKFAGEDSFIVPKPGTKKFLMAIASETTLIDKQNAINAEVVPLDNTTIINPTEAPSDSQTTTTPPVMIQSPDWSSLDCKQILVEIESIQNMLMVSKFSSDVYDAYQKIIQEGKQVYTLKCEKTILPTEEPIDLPPAPPVYSEPSWSTMTCEQIKMEINAIGMMLADPNTSAENLSILKMSYENGKKAYERCNVSETPLEPNPPISSGGGGGVGAPPITTITTTGTPIIATTSAGGLTSSGMPKSLGGGGGSGTSKQDPSTTPKKEGVFNIWWLVAGAVVIYLFSTRKS
jgi:hypothetical protein